MAVTLFKGANEFENNQVIGQTIRSLRETPSIVDVLNLDGNEKVKVNGYESNDSIVLSDGDSVEFYKPQGSKG